MAGARGIEAGRAFVRLFADNSELVRTLRKSEWHVRQFGKSVEHVGRQLTMIGVAGIAGIAAVSRVFASFDDQMRLTQAVTQATGQQFDNLTQQAKELGRTTSFTAAQVAAAMVELGRAGFASKEIESAIPNVLNLARSTGTELADAAQIAAASLRVFNIEASETERVADVLSITANRSAMTLTDLGEAMKYAGPVASAYGMSLEQTSKALGALANFGIKGSLAGNTLKNVMLQLADPSVRSKIESLGVAVTDAAGNMRDVSDILPDLGNAIRDLPSGERLALFNDLFGRRAVAGGIKIATANFHELNDAIDNAAGSAAKTSNAMDAGLGGSIRRMLSALEGVIIALGEGLAGSVDAATKKITIISGNLARWIELNHAAIAALAKLILKITATGVALLVLGKAIGALAIALKVGIFVFTAITAAVKLFGAIAAAMAATTMPMVINGMRLLAASSAAATAPVVGLSVGMRILGAAMTWVAANPLAAIGIGIAALAGGIFGVSKLVGMLTDKIRSATGAMFDFSAITTRTAEQVAGENAALKEKANRLVELRTKQDQTNEEMIEALQIAVDLKSAYPELASEIDLLGTSADATADAFARMSEAMQESYVLANQAELKAMQERRDQIQQRIQQRNDANMQNPNVFRNKGVADYVFGTDPKRSVQLPAGRSDELKNLGVDFNTYFQGMKDLVGTSGLQDEADVAKLNIQISALTEATQKMVEAIETRRNSPEPLPIDPLTPREIPKSEEAVDLESKLQKRLNELNVRAATSGMEQELALFDLAFAEMVDEARAAGADMAMVEAVGAAERLAIQKKYADDAAKEAEAQAKLEAEIAEQAAKDELQAMSDRMADDSRGLNDLLSQLADLQAVEGLSGIDRDLAMINREREKAIGEAVRGQSTTVGKLRAIELTNQIYDLQIQEAGARAKDGLQQADSRRSAAGTFFSTATDALLSGDAMDRTAKATETIVEINAKIEKNTAEGGLYT